jgi:glutamate racemase
MMKAGIDSLVLGCTHYPFLRPAFENMLESEGCDVVVIDPALAVARQTGRVLAGLGEVQHEGGGKVLLFTTGDAPDCRAKVLRLANISDPALGVRWEDGRIVQQGTEMRSES